MQCLDTLQDIIRPFVNRQRQDILNLPPVRKIEIVVRMATSFSDTRRISISFSDTRRISIRR